MYDIFNKQLKFIRNLISNFLSDASIDPESQNRCLKWISDVKNMQKRGITLVSTLNDRKVIFCHLPMAAILDLCKLQNLPKVATPATKLNILHGPIQVWNHHKTIHFSWQQGPWIGNWTITCWRCSTYVFILNLTPRFNELDKGNSKTRQEKIKVLEFGDGTYYLTE